MRFAISGRSRSARRHAGRGRACRGSLRRHETAAAPPFRRDDPAVRGPVLPAGMTRGRRVIDKASGAAL